MKLERRCRSFDDADEQDHGMFHVGKGATKTQVVVEELMVGRFLKKKNKQHNNHNHNSINNINHNCISNVDAIGNRNSKENKQDFDRIDGIAKSKREVDTVKRKGDHGMFGHIRGAEKSLVVMEDRAAGRYIKKKHPIKKADADVDRVDGIAKSKRDIERNKQKGDHGLFPAAKGAEISSVVSEEKLAGKFLKNTPKKTTNDHKQLPDHDRIDGIAKSKRDVDTNLKRGDGGMFGAVHATIKSTVVSEEKMAGSYLKKKSTGTTKNKFHNLEMDRIDGLALSKRATKNEEDENLSFNELCNELSLGKDDRGLFHDSFLRQPKAQVLDEEKVAGHLLKKANHAQTKHQYQHKEMDRMDGILPRKI